MKDFAEQSSWAGRDHGDPCRARTVLVLCSTFRDHRELPRLARPGVSYLFHDYASTSFEELIGGRAEGLGRRRRSHRRGCSHSCRHWGSRHRRRGQHRRLSGKRACCSPRQGIGLVRDQTQASTSSASTNICRAWRKPRIVPETVPALLVHRCCRARATPRWIVFPVFAKPVKSFFSIGAQRIDSAAELAAGQASLGQARRFLLTSGAPA